jgi:hypothetical protein
MDIFFGKIKSKKFEPYQYRYNNYREYIEAQYNHIRYLETTIETLVHDVMVLDNRLKFKGAPPLRTPETDIQRKNPIDNP